MLIFGEKRKVGNGFSLRTTFPFTVPLDLPVCTFQQQYCVEQTEGKFKSTILNMGRDYNHVIIRINYIRFFSWFSSFLLVDDYISNRMIGSAIAVSKQTGSKDLSKWKETLKYLVCKSEVRCLFIETNSRATDTRTPTHGSNPQPLQ